MSLGRTLKETRIKRGISLTDVSRELLVNEEYLEAIEDGMDDRLPSETYKRIYTRAYCKFLGVEFRESVLESTAVKPVTTHNEKFKQNQDVEVTRKATEDKSFQSRSFELDFPFDINRAFRITVKVVVTVLGIYLIIRFFQWIF